MWHLFSFAFDVFLVLLFSQSIPGDDVGDTKHVLGALWWELFVWYELPSSMWRSFVLEKIGNKLVVPLEFFFWALFWDGAKILGGVVWVEGAYHTGNDI